MADKSEAVVKVKVKQCPLLLAASEGGLEPCIRLDCAWFDEHGLIGAGDCAMLSLATSMTAIAFTTENMLRRM